jgi:HSP20 family protein
MNRTVSRSDDRNQVSHLYNDPFPTLETRMNQLFRGMLDSSGAADMAFGPYPVDVAEDDDKIVIETELPGFQQDEINVNVENGVLSINAERKLKHSKAGTKRHLQERRFTRVQRAFTLPRTVDGSDVDAHLDAGILTLTLKKTEESKPRKIEIRASSQSA